MIPATGTGIFLRLSVGLLKKVEATLQKGVLAVNKNVSGTVRGLMLVTTVLAVAGCGLPRTGPNKAEIFQGSVLEQGDADRKSTRLNSSHG